MISVPKPSPDPTLVAQQQMAQASDTQQIQRSLGQDTQNLWNMFGNGTQMSYVQLPGPAAPSAPSAPAAGKA